MDTILSILNWLATVGTLILGVYMYRKHTRRLNEQQKQLNEQQGRINDYLLKGMEESEQKKKERVYSVRSHKDVSWGSEYLTDTK